MDEEEGKKYSLFGRDLSDIPCFRSSWLYGVSGGVASGLLYFMFTSKPRIATHFGFSATIGITATYWVICRYQFEQRALEIKKMQELVERRVLAEGTEMEKLFKADIDVAVVSNVADV